MDYTLLDRCKMLGVGRPACERGSLCSCKSVQSECSFVTYAITGKVVSASCSVKERGLVVVVANFAIRTDQPSNFAVRTDRMYNDATSKLERPGEIDVTRNCKFDRKPH